MRLPQRPPPESELREVLADPDVLHMLQEAGLHRPTVRDRYVHWDQLRRYPLPEGISHREWWAAIRLAREAHLSPFGLIDTEGREFRFGAPDPVQRRTSEIDRDLSGRLRLPDELAHDDTRDRYRVSALIEEAITSSQLEGAATTSVVAREMLRSRRRPRDHGERMIYNNHAAMQLVRELAEAPLTREAVLRLHERVTEETLEDGEVPGALRLSDDVAVSAPDGLVLHRPPPARELGERMERMCAFANGELPERFVHPVVRATLLHFWLAYDHPFSDGNGRTARALFYWSMLRSGYWLCEFVSISHILRGAPARYARSYLHAETDGGDATYFVLYQLEVLQQGIEALHAYVRRKVERLERTRRLLRSSPGFNHRQLALLGHALAHPRARYTVQSHATSHRVTRQTARTDLNGLVEHGLLLAVEEGRRRVYLPADELEARARDLGAHGGPSSTPDQ